MTTAAPDDFTDADVVACYHTIRDGGVALVRVDVGYALFARSDDAVARIYSLKGRPADKPCVLVGDVAVFADVSDVDATRLAWVERVAARTSVGVVAPADSASLLLGTLSQFARSRLLSEGSVATFLSQGTFADRLVAMAAEDCVLFLCSSANASDAGNSPRFEDVDRAIRDGVDWRKDLGTGRYAEATVATTMVDLGRLVVLRSGANAGLIEAELADLRRTVRP